MPVLKFRSPVTLPLHRADWVRPPGVYEFVVTQRFGSLDGYYKGQAHGAVDIGNFRCHDPIVAMAAGNVRRVKDGAAAAGLAATDALGVVIDHGYGITTEYWHLDAWVGPATGWVQAGQQIGILGDTGIGAVCHCHIEAKRNGVRFDPEPLMFGGSINTDGEDDMRLPNAGYFATGRVGPGNRLRLEHSTTEGSEVIPDGVVLDVQLLGIVTGGTPYTLTDGRTGNRWYIVRRADNGDVRQVAHQLVTGIAPTPHLFNQVPLPDADCTHEVSAATLAARDAEKERWQGWLGTAPK